jgi:hypothetical protein
MSRGPMSIRVTQDRFVYGQFTVQSDSTTESRGLSSFVITTVTPTKKTRARTGEGWVNSCYRSDGSLRVILHRFIFDVF